MPSPAPPTDPAGSERPSDPIFANEESFHDSWAAGIDVGHVLVEAGFEGCTSPENRALLQALGDLHGKSLLELGCGAGEASVYFAKRGARVTATDISSGMLEVVQRLAARHGVSVDTRQMRSHALDFPDGTFDIVYAANLLHHVDIDTTAREAHRVLKPGGIFAAWDPLEHNPLIQVYRRIARQVRTADEHPLRMCDVGRFRRLFTRVDVTTTWFFTLLIFLKFFCIDRLDPNSVRYWKKIIADHKALEHLYRPLERLDAVILKRLPFLRRYCWNIVLVCRK